MDTSKQAVAATADERNRQEGERILRLYRRQMTKFTRLALLFGAIGIALLMLLFVFQPLMLPESGWHKLIVVSLTLGACCGAVLSVYVRQIYKQWHDSLAGFMANHEKEISGA